MVRVELEFRFSTHVDSENPLSSEFDHLEGNVDCFDKEICKKFIHLPGKFKKKSSPGSCHEGSNKMTGV